MAPAALPSPMAPGLWRRMACFVYEGVLLFGVLMAAGLVYGLLTRQAHALVGTLGLQIFVFAVLGAYFVGFWTRTGQTLAMQTWQVRLLTTQGLPVTWRRGLARYLLSWLWFMPALVSLWASGLKGGLPVFSALLTGVCAYAALSRLHPRRQFWHDAVCGTCLVRWRPPTSA